MLLFLISTEKKLWTIDHFRENWEHMKANLSRALSLFGEPPVSPKIADIGGGNSEFSGGLNKDSREKSS